MVNLHQLSHMGLFCSYIKYFTAPAKLVLKHFYINLICRLLKADTLFSINQLINHSIR